MKKSEIHKGVSAGWGLQEWDTPKEEVCVCGGGRVHARWGLELGVWVEFKQRLFSCN